MTHKHLLLLIICWVINSSVYSQKKTLQSKLLTSDISIDGRINENAWFKNSSVATDFVMYEPDNGKPISNEKRTEVKVLHDNTAIYIAAVLYDDEPHKILREVTNRDVFGASDHFSVFINGFNDGQQDYRFYVSAAGVQMDCLATKDAEDFTWDAIWESKVRIASFGWVVEMKIPYAALRFTDTQKQIWGVNFMREIKRNVQKYTWNFIDTRVGNVTNQAGVLEGINDISPPTRLFLIPYTSAYYQQDKTTSDRTVKAGLDIKYGINASFTLDAILIPDFGQTKFDNSILNLDPFEQNLTENRPFFTEGTNLFSKGNIFYSRRIGGSPVVEKETLEGELNTNEEITNYPSSVDLINAIKISGRTKKGLGIGVLNAVTEKTVAKISNKVTNENRESVIQPLTNYNIVVLDQRFRQNSSVTFLNTNTMRNGAFRDANVSALLFDLNTKENTYNLYGDFKYSTTQDVENLNGIKSQLGFAKTSGQYRYAFLSKYVSKDYDSNDLGLLYFTNYHSGYAEGSYRIINPTRVFNTFKIKESVNVELDNPSGKLQNATLETELKATNLKNDYYEFILDINPMKTYDFYEPRVVGRYSYIPANIFWLFNYSSNENRPFSIVLQPSTTFYKEKNRINYWFYSVLKYRFNTRLSLSLTSEYQGRINDRGWAAFDNNDIVYSKRKRQFVQNDLIGKYAINNRMTLNLTARYYWSYSDIDEFSTLQNNGELTPNTSFSMNKNRNFNSWNFDLSYSWWFAPGSEISVLYRNYTQLDSNNVERNFSTNFNNVFKGNMTDIFSVRLRYFIDYNSISK
ncbi:DUF5916 domain-containing protein [Flavobacterium sp. UMI-01]|uniref:DUF5916 domain-containing protein n=1 Tax=Flavobacterium sp. UMI-01 TaxID=1441053 RepID=UPI001C7D9648|nr:DUF5916 domain-containing protein [Flavobacterium sp. UMI-01]GIZ08980.1 hypothetical protein FUMI01_17070 [Flavobacterium sp. UMI-01]